LRSRSSAVHAATGRPAAGAADGSRVSLLLLGASRVYRTQWISAVFFIRRQRADTSWPRSSFVTASASSADVPRKTSSKSRRTLPFCQPSVPGVVRNQAPSRKVRHARWAIRFSNAALDAGDTSFLSHDWVKWTATRPGAISLNGAPASPQSSWSFRSFRSGRPLSGLPSLNRNAPRARLTFSTSTSVTVRNSDRISGSVTCHPPPSMYAGAGDGSTSSRRVASANGFLTEGLYAAPTLRLFLRLARQAEPGVRNRLEARLRDRPIAVLA